MEVPCPFEVSRPDQDRQIRREASDHRGTRVGPGLVHTRTATPGPAPPFDARIAFFGSGFCRVRNLRSAPCWSSFEIVTAIDFLRSRRSTADPPCGEETGWRTSGGTAVRAGALWGQLRQHDVLGARAREGHASDINGAIEIAAQQDVARRVRRHGHRREEGARHRRWQRPA